MEDLAEVTTVPAGVENSLKFDGEQARASVVLFILSKPFDNSSRFVHFVLGPTGCNDLQGDIACVSLLVVTNEPNCRKAAMTKFVQDGKAISNPVPQFNGAKTAFEVFVRMLTTFPSHLRFGVWGSTSISA